VCEAIHCKLQHVGHLQCSDCFGQNFVIFNKKKNRANFGIFFFPSVISLNFAKFLEIFAKKLDIDTKTEKKKRKKSFLKNLHESVFSKFFLKNNSQNNKNSLHQKTHFLDHINKKFTPSLQNPKEKKTKHP
jgi:hypothetical protein